MSSPVPVNPDDSADCAYCKRALAVVSVICSALVLAVGALGIWVYSVNTDYLKGIYLNRNVSEANGVKIEHVLDVTAECRRLGVESLGLLNQNNTALSRLLERMEVRNAEGHDCARPK